MCVHRRTYTQDVLQSLQVLLGQGGAQSCGGCRKSVTTPDFTANVCPWHFKTTDSSTFQGRAASPKLRHVKFEDRSFPSTRVPHRCCTLLPPFAAFCRRSGFKMTSALLLHCSSHCQLAFVGSTPRHEVRRAPIRTALRAAACKPAGEQAFDWRKAAAATALSASLCLSGPAWCACPETGTLHMDPHAAWKPVFKTMHTLDWTIHLIG